MHFDTAVLIAGGGPTGLSAAIALARLGVPSLLVERQTSPSIHPKATGVSVRTMELFRAWGVDDAVRRAGLQVRPDVSVSQTLASAEVARQPLLRADAVGAASAEDAVVVAQNELEPILAEHARRFRDAEIRFGTELMAFEQDPAGVQGELVDRATGQQRRVRARYLVAADGAASSVRSRLGVRMVGVERVSRYVSVIFQADLERFVAPRRAGAYRIDHPHVQGVIRPTSLRGRWLLSMPWQGARDPLQAVGAAPLVELVRTAIGTADLDVEIVNVQVFDVGAQVADRFRDGRVFLAGDAAHRMSPSGALGMNTGIHDVHNLAWKLAAATQGWSGDMLLDTYEQERRPVAERNVARSLGLRRDLTPQSIDLGAAYVSEAVSGTGPALTTVMRDVSAPAWPGCRAPHVWLESGGNRISTLDLWNERFVLLTGDRTAGEVWAACAWSAARDLSVPFAAFTIGPDGNLQDRTGAWHTRYGIEPTGAVLVRPDGHIAWRARRPVSNPIGEIAAAMTRILGRAPGAVAAWPPPWVRAHAMPAEPPLRLTTR